MTTTLRARRASLALRIVAAAAALAVLAFMVVSITGHALRAASADGPVVPELTSERLEQIRRISVRSSDGAFTMERLADGGAWVMRERGDYPVRPEQLAALAEGLQALRFERRMTSDPEKLDRIGLGDPAAGGRGVLLQMEDAAGALVVDLVLGVASETGGAYVRRNGQDQAWAVAGELPPLREAAGWLALAPLSIAPEDILRADIAPPEGRAFGLVRRVGEDGAPTQPANFGLAPPLSGVDVSAGVSLSDLAVGLTAIEPIDVAPAAAVQGPARARITLFTSTAIAVDAEITTVGEEFWLKLNARATVATPEAEAAAAAVNQSGGAWAYRLTNEAAAALTPVYDSLLPQTGVEAEGQPFLLP
jgi:hypothetical protein